MTINVWHLLAVVPGILLLLNQVIDVRPYPNLRRDYWILNAVYAVPLVTCLLLGFRGARDHRHK